MPQEIKPEDNSDENPTDSAPPASEQQIAAGVNAGEIPTDAPAASAQQIAAGDSGGEIPTNAPPASAQQKVRITIVGSRKAVLKTIHTLYLLGFAEVSDWSPPQPVKNSSDVASSLIRRQGTGAIEPSVKPNK